MKRRSDWALFAIALLFLAAISFRDFGTNGSPVADAVARICARTTVACTGYKAAPEDRAVPVAITMDDGSTVVLLLIFDAAGKYLGSIPLK